MKKLPPHILFLIFLNIIQFFYIFRKRIFTKACIDTHKFQEFIIDKDFRNKNGYISFDSLDISKANVRNKDKVSFRFKSNSYPYIKLVDFSCKGNIEYDYIRLSKDSLLSIHYALDVLGSAEFYLRYEEGLNKEKKINPQEAYRTMMNNNLIDSKSKMFYGYNKDSLEQLIIHQSKKKDSETPAPSGSLLQQQ